MNPNKLLQNIRLGWSPFILIAVTTLATIAISIYCLLSGWVIVFQNLFYIPIIIACVYYTKKGFAFSVVLSFIYLFLIIAFTRDSAIIMQALIRIFIFVGVAGVATFLSIKRKRAEKVLRESEERYRTILNIIEEGYFEVDIPGNFTFFNDSLCRVLGYSRDEMMGMNNRQYMDKENAQKVYQVFNRAYTTGEPHISFNWEIVKKDGTKRFVESSVSLIRDSKGERIGFRGIARDITERKRAEEELRESEKRYFDLFKNANDIIYTHNLVGNFTSINRAGERVSGYTKEEALALNISEIVAPEYLKLILEALGPESLGKGPLIHELEIITKDGRRVPLELSTRLIFKEQKPIGVEGIARDITGRKKLEEERETLIKELQEAIARVKLLSGMLPICASCKKIRDDKGYWNQVEVYIRDHSEAEFSHGICPECMKKLYPDFADEEK